jgi:hypothetical protein
MIGWGMACIFGKTITQELSFGQKKKKYMAK